MTGTLTGVRRCRDKIEYVTMALMERGRLSTPSLAYTWNPIPRRARRRGERKRPGLRSRPMRHLIALAYLIFAVPAFGADLSGPARIIDGDTIEISGQRIRLYGIDAPEGGQTCKARGIEYDCGENATTWLIDLTAGKAVTCKGRDVDRYGRIVATCSAGGVNLNAGIVAAGWAVAYRRYSLDYVSAENSARKARRGMWAGEFMMPWEWRRSHPR